MRYTEKEYGMMRERAGLIQEAREILNKAEREGRGLRGEEERHFNDLLGKADVIAKKISPTIPTSDRASLEEIESDMRKLTSEPVLEGPGGIINLQTGEEVRMLRREERLADHVRYNLPAGIQASELSLGRFVRGLVTGNWKGSEAEKRTMAEGLDVSGGYLVPTPLALNVIDLARNKAVCFLAGATTIPMDSKTLDVGVVESDPVAYWRAENVAITASDMTFARKQFQAHTLGVLVKSSIELFEDANNIDSLISNAISSAIALELDRVILRGLGAAEEPCGIRNWTGIQTIDLGTNGDVVRYDDFSEAWQKVQEENGPSEGLSVIYSPREAGEVDRYKDGEGLPLKPPASWEKMRKFVTNQIPIDLTKGTSNNASEAYVGHFPDCWVGMRTQVFLEASRTAADSSSSAFSQMQVWLRAYLRADVVLARPGWFVLIDGIIPAV